MSSDAPNRKIGQHIGNYRLLSWLGQGSFADVYLGEHILLKRLAAIKVLKVSLSDEEREDFLNEARTIARLDHPHIIRVLECGFDYTRPFLVMNYAGQGSLRQHYPRGTRLSPAKALPYVQQAAAALHYSHQQKLIHRDVKPENMLLDDRSQLLLTDFGLALVYQSIGSQPSLETAGTVAYIAPEQLQGQTQFASDQYALGIVAYEWLCGERPFKGNFEEIANQHILVPPPPLREKVPDLPVEVEQVVLRALSKDPAQRFVDIEVFAGALAEAVLGTPSLSINNLTPFPIEDAIEAVRETPNQRKDTDRLSLAKSSLPAFAKTPPVSPLSPPASPSRISSPKKIRPTRHRKLALLAIGLLILLTGGASLGYIISSRVSPPGPSTYMHRSGTNQTSTGTPNSKGTGSGGTGQGGTGAGGTGRVSPDTKHTGNTTSNTSNTNPTSDPGNTNTAPNTGNTNNTSNTSNAPSNSSTSPTPTPTSVVDCISTTPQSLTFTSLLGQDPVAQILTVTNCGNTSSALGYTTNSNWISIVPTASTINSQGSTVVTIAIISLNAGLGVHHGSVDLSLGTAHQTIAVTYTAT